MIGPLTYLDAALIAVAFISGLLAMYRGFAREMLSIVSWLVAAGAVPIGLRQLIGHRERLVVLSHGVVPYKVRIMCVPMTVLLFDERCRR